MPIFLRPYRPVAVCLLSLLLEACGGGSSSGSASGPTSQDLAAANDAQLQSTFDVATNRVTLQWYPRFANTSRYQVEQQDAAGSWVIIDGAWAPEGGEAAPSLTWTSTVSVPATLRVEAVLPGYEVPLETFSQGSQPATSITVAPPVPLPTIALDQPEPLENPTNVSLVNGGTYTGIIYSIDTLSDGFAESFGQSPLPPPAYPATLNPDTYTTGTHLIYAQLRLSSASTVVISRSVNIHDAKLAIELLSSALSPESFDAYVSATSDSGIASVVGEIDVVPLDTLTAPNACAPMPCAAGQAFNAYHLSINIQHLTQGFHGFTAVATDNAGDTAFLPVGQSLTLPPPASATLVSPSDGSLVSGTLHLAGTFYSPTPGALELLVTLSGEPIYDTTVANTGLEIPFSTDVSLAGVPAGAHTLGVYARVGNASYTQAATVVIQVTPAQ